VTTTGFRPQSCSWTLVTNRASACHIGSRRLNDGKNYLQTRRTRVRYFWRPDYFWSSDCKRRRTEFPQGPIQACSWQYGRYGVSDHWRPLARRHCKGYTRDCALGIRAI